MKSSKEHRMKHSKALVFDIKRFAVHDGKGIRTTIFLKGCPLRCRWCQNPEGLDVRRGVMFIASKCIHCQICHQTCPEKIRWENNRPYFHPYDDIDTAVEACPSTALSYDCKEYDTKTLVQRIMQDKVFFDHGGGVTFSGGEPFLQFDALIDLLMECHKEGIHTAVESSLYTDQKWLIQALPYLDQIFCDLKIFDETKHIWATGISNRSILENIRFLLQTDKKDIVTVRTPLIPNYTAYDDNIASIASFLSSFYPDVQYELLNYNPLAPAKYPFTQFTYGVKEETKPLTPPQMQHFKDLAKQNGLRHVS